MRIPLSLCGLLIACSALAAEKDPACGPGQSKTIETKATCADHGGAIAIGVSPDESSAYACLESKTVQNRCGLDGSLTRLRAYQLWLKNVKEFETACTSRGGHFSYEDPLFREPINESFCSQAVPEMTTNMFEDTLCNFRSACPAVKVRCEQGCSSASIALLD